MKDLQDYLTIYLNDHRAGAAAGIGLAHRLWRQNRKGPWASQLRELLKSVEAEGETLDAVRGSIGVTGGKFRRTAAVALERASRLKLNGHVLSYSPLSRVGELEALMSGVQSKLRLWTTLDLATPSVPELVEFDFPTLQRQSHAQLATLGQIHEWAVGQCFVGG